MKSPSRRTLPIVIATIVASATVAAAPAGAATAVKLRTKADRICTELARAFVEVVQENGLPQSLEDDVALVEELLPTFEAAQEELAELKPPKALRADYREYLDLREQRLENDRAFLEAAEQNDTARIEQLGQELTSIRDQYEAVGADLGFYACAERLTEDEEQKVRDVVEETFTTGDPAFCTEKYTEEFVRVYAGGQDQCIAAESDPANASSAIDIELVKGVDKVRATVRLTPADGPSAGQTIETDLIYEDGVYKRNAIYSV